MTTVLNKYLIESSDSESNYNKNINKSHNTKDKKNKKEIFVDVSNNTKNFYYEEDDKNEINDKNVINNKQDKKDKKHKDKKKHNVEFNENKSDKICVENYVKSDKTKSKNTTNYYQEKKISCDFDFGIDVGEKKDVPKKYGSKWTDDDRNELTKMLSSSSKIMFNLDSNENKTNIFEYSPGSNNDGDILIKKIAKALDRTEGGIRAEIKKIIFDKYIRGETTEKISETLNLTYKNVKSTIKMQLDKECDNEILILEKENKLLSLKIENKKLKSKLKLLDT
jgi:hypothetical protein